VKSSQIYNTVYSKCEALPEMVQNKMCLYTACEESTL